MRVKLLRDEDGATVRLVYPSTLDEYGEAIETLGALAAPVGDDGPDADGGVDVAIHVSYVVTTESQRAGWQLPDLCSSGCARVVDESEAFGLLRAPADAPPPTRWDGGPDGPVSEALRALGAPDTRLEQVLEALGRVALPGGVCETLRRELRRGLDTFSQLSVSVIARGERISGTTAFTSSSTLPFLDQTRGAKLLAMFTVYHGTYLQCASHIVRNRRDFAPLVKPNSWPALALKVSKTSGGTISCNGLFFPSAGRRSASIGLSVAARGGGAPFRSAEAFTLTKPPSQPSGRLGGRPLPGPAARPSR